MIGSASVETCSWLHFGACTLHPQGTISIMAYVHNLIFSEVMTGALYLKRIYTNSPICSTRQPFCLSNQAILVRARIHGK